MSKYEEICAAYSKSRRLFSNYEKVCQDFARNLVFGMIEYFEWPRDQEVTYLSLGEEIDPTDRFYALAGAMRMDDQSFWHFGVELEVHEARTGANPVSFVMSFFVKKVGPYFVVKLGPKGKEIKIHEEQEQSLEPLYDAVFAQITDFFARRYFQAITQQETELGFITLT